MTTVFSWRRRRNQPMENLYLCLGVGICSNNLRVSSIILWRSNLQTRCSFLFYQNGSVNRCKILDHNWRPCSLLTVQLRPTTLPKSHLQCGLYRCLCRNTASLLHFRERRWSHKEMLTSWRPPEMGVFSVICQIHSTERFWQPFQISVCTMMRWSEWRRIEIMFLVSPLKSFQVHRGTHPSRSNESTDIPWIPGSIVAKRFGKYNQLRGSLHK